MPKSKHRKNHKKKVAHYKLMQKHKKRAYQKKIEEMWGEELAKAMAEAQKREGGDNQDMNDIGGLIG